PESSFFCWVSAAAFSTSTTGRSSAAATAWSRCSTCTAAGIAARSSRFDMYSPLIVDRALAAYTKRTGFKLRRYLPGESITRARDLDKKHAAETPLTADDRRFIR